MVRLGMSCLGRKRNWRLRVPKRGQSTLSQEPTLAQINPNQAMGHGWHYSEAVNRCGPAPEQISIVGADVFVVSVPHIGESIERLADEFGAVHGTGMVAMIPVLEQELRHGCAQHPLDNPVLRFSA